MVYSQPEGISIHKVDLQLTCRQMDTLVLSDRLTAGRWYTSMVYSLPAGRYINTQKIVTAFLQLETYTGMIYCLPVPR
jgi:hypothetical protein